MRVADENLSRARKARALTALTNTAATMLDIVGRRFRHRIFTFIEGHIILLPACGAVAAQIVISALVCLGQFTAVHCICPGT